MKESSSRADPEKRPDVAQIRKIYNVALWLVIATLFILAPLYLLIAVYPQKLF